jgi:subtilase family serine protease
MVPPVLAQSTGAPAEQIHHAIDESKLMTLTGNTRPEANAQNDRGPVAGDFQLDHMLLQLQRSPAREAALDQYIADLHNPQSASFHKWLTPDQFNTTFGVASDDLTAVANWLQSHGFSVAAVQANGLTLDFSGTAAMVRSAFHTEIHSLQVNGRMHFANMSDPQIPAVLAPVVAGVVSLHNFHPKPLLLKKNPAYTYNTGTSTTHALVPGDLATIYNINPLFAHGYTGKGQSIMVVEDTYLYSTEDWKTFRNKFGLSSPYPHAALSQVSPKGRLTCTNPGFQGDPNDPGYGDDSEAAIDVEWASAAAPDAAIILAACEDTSTTFGGLIALQNTLNGPSANLPSVVSVSYGESESLNGAAANLAYKNAYQQAVAEGVSVFVSAGDEGAAESDNGNVSTNGITVSGFASTPYNVAVGGLDFGYTADGISPGNYWSSTNTSTYASALSYIQEIPWNTSCAGALEARFLGTTPLSLCNNPEVTNPNGSLNSLLNATAGSGGPSGCATGSPSNSAPGAVSGSCKGYAKPAWQRILGNPEDGARDLPDISLFASNGFWDAYYVVCWSDPNTDPIVGGGFTCKGAPSNWSGFGGTSVSAPIMAGIQALVNEKTASRWGNPNPTYYALANAEYGVKGSQPCNSSLGGRVSHNCIFYDVTQGDNDVVCQASDHVVIDCYLPKHDTYGVLSLSNSSDKPAYLTSVGWDFATGIGSVNAWNLVMNWPKP